MDSIPWFGLVGFRFVSFRFGLVTIQIILETEMNIFHAQKKRHFGDIFLIIFLFLFFRNRSFRQEKTQKNFFNPKNFFFTFR